MTQAKGELYLPQPSFLWFLVLSYTMVMVMANWFDARLIRIFNLDTDAGTLIFPFSFLLADMITEVYGYQQARRAIWCGFLFNIVFILYGLLIVHLPGPEYALSSNSKFDEIQTMNLRIIIASSISYLCSEPLNSLIMAKLKILCSGNKLAVRFVISTALASGIDSIIFSTIAFIGMMESNELFWFTVSMWSIKVALQILGIPASLYLTKKLKESEHLDIYDTSTNFNVFRLDVDYSKRNNEY